MSGKFQSQAVSIAEIDRQVLVFVSAHPLIFWPPSHLDKGK